MNDSAPAVLFVCVHNAGRSQMAAALFNRKAAQLGLALRAESAGTEPAEHVHASVVDVMAEIGLDVSAARPSLLSDDTVAKAARVITMGCAVDSQACPSLLYTDVEDWGLPDPAGQPVEQVRDIRDEIERRVESLIAAMRA